MAKIIPTVTSIEESNSGGEKGQVILTSDQTRLVQSSFQMLVPVAGAFVESFYDKLLTNHPELHSIFTSVDMKKQHAKLVSAMVMLVQQLNDMEGIRARLGPLGKRHVSYGALAEHYDYITQSMIYALKMHMKEAFTDAVEDAWRTTFTVISTIMQEGSTEEQQEISKNEGLIPTLPAPIVVGEEVQAGPCLCLGFL